MSVRDDTPLLSSDADNWIESHSDEAHQPPVMIHRGRFNNYQTFKEDQKSLSQEITTSGSDCGTSSLPQPANQHKAVNYEGLDYDTIENSLYTNEEVKMTMWDWRWILFQRWFICIAIGVLTGLVAVAINISIIEITDVKMQLITKALDRCVLEGCLYIPLLIWISINIALTLIAALITVYLSPVAAGSGIPQIKCFLNGIKVPDVVRLKTLVTKVVGVVAAVSGGLAVGKEGPMIHSGAVIAAGVSQGRSLTFQTGGNLFKHFRNDREKRDFVSAGAAAGVSAAFGAPVGGVLFSLEEAASFWNQALTWRIFLCSILSSYTLNICMSSYRGHPGDLSYPGLINFGTFSGSYSFPDFFIFIAMGFIGGVFGAAFVAFNHVITKFRIKYMKRHRVAQVLEVVVVTTVSATVAFVMMYVSTANLNRAGSNGTSSGCRPLGQDQYVKLQFMCGDGEYDTMSALFFPTPEDSVKSLFHDQPGTFTPLGLLAFIIVYFFISCWTYGLQVPSGLFIPSLLLGAAWGRLIGILINKSCPSCPWTADMSKYALIGAAAQLGGTVRMTISLTVILMEATADLTYSLPLMIVLMVSKLTGDFFNKGIYDMHVHMSRVPILEWEPPPLSSNILAKEVMSSPVVTLGEVPTVLSVCSVLSEPGHCHSGYPVTDDGGKFRGFILRSQLLVLLRHKAFVERRGPLSETPTLSTFRDSYPRNPPVSYLNVSEDEQKFCHLDLRPYLNPAPYTVYEAASLPRIFRLFRALGLRHVVVINDNFEVVGIVTRKDIWKWGHETAHKK